MDRRFGVELCVADLADDPDHLETIGISLGTERIGVDRLVGACEQIAEGLEVPDRRMDVDRLHGVAAVHLHGVEGLGEIDETAEVGPVAGTTTAGAIGHVGRARHRGERDMITTDTQVVGRVGGVEGELRRRRGDEVGDELGIEPDPLAVDPGPGVAPQAKRLRVEEVEPCLAQHRERREMNGFQLVVGHHPRGLEATTVQPPRRLGGPLRAGRPLPPPATDGGGHPVTSATR